MRQLYVLLICGVSGGYDMDVIQQWRCVLVGPGTDDLRMEWQRLQQIREI